MDAVVVTRSVDLAAPPERVWPLVSDTDRFNRLLGMSEVRYRPVDAANTSVPKLAMMTPIVNSRPTESSGRTSP